MQLEHNEHAQFDFEFTKTTDPGASGFFFDGTAGTYDATINDTMDGVGQTCPDHVTIDSHRSGGFVWPPAGDQDAIALFEGYDQNNPNVHGDVAALAPVIPIQTNEVEIAGGPFDPCAPAVTTTTPRQTNPFAGSVQCIPAAAQSEPFGPLPLYGVYGELDGKRFFDFACEQDIVNGGVSGHISVTGKLYILDGSA